MKRLALALLAFLLASPAMAADNYSATAGSGLTFGAKDSGGVLFSRFIGCDNTTPSQCWVVDASGRLGIALVSGSVASGAFASGSIATGAIVDLGAPGATACASDTASCNTNQQLQRIAQNLTAINNNAASPLATQGSSISIGGVGVIGSAGSGGNQLAVNSAGGINTTPTAGVASGATPSFVVAANSNNSTSVKGSAGTVYSLQTSNINASTAYFIKLYDKATAPTCGTDTPVAGYVIPPSNGGNNVQIAVGKKFTLGIGYCVVAGIANNDNTSVPAATILVNVDYN